MNTHHAFDLRSASPCDRALFEATKLRDCSLRQDISGRARSSCRKAMRQHAFKWRELFAPGNDHPRIH